jgi:hypothetical protein
MASAAHRLRITGLVKTNIARIIFKNSSHDYFVLKKFLLIEYEALTPHCVTLMDSWNVQHLLAKFCPV